MKAARRQELRTNELSQHIDRLSETFKQNSKMLTAVVVGVAVVVVAIYLYSNHRATVVSDGVARLTYDPGTDTPQSFIDRCRAVANENISTEVTRMAWLRAGTAALDEMAGMANPGSPDADKPAVNKDELAKTANEAFTRLLAVAGNDTNAKGAALFGLAILEENAGNFDAARKRYESIKSDAAFKNSPFAAQAEYRLAQLPAWSEPIAFAPPPTLPEAPEGLAPANVQTISQEPNFNAIPGIVPVESSPSPAEESPAEKMPVEEPPVESPTTAPSN